MSELNKLLTITSEPAFDSVGNIIAFNLVNKP